MHYLAGSAGSIVDSGISTDEWNRRIDAFDVKGLVQQLIEVRAGYFFITLGQNSGFFLSPNETYDRLVGRTPSRLSRRDLIADLITELAETDIRVMVYLPSHAPALDRQAVETLCCTPFWDASCWQLRPGTYMAQDGTDERLTQFQRNWEAIIREWSLRWGHSVHGWWFDGCYYADRMYRSTDEPNFSSFATAARAGNSHSLVAFNPGVTIPVTSHTEYEDYTAGEIADALPSSEDMFAQRSPSKRCIDGAQYHILTYLGQTWGKGTPRFSDETVIGFTKEVNRFEGVVTWDIPPTPEGHIADLAFEQLTALCNATR